MTVAIAQKKQESLSERIMDDLCEQLSAALCSCCPAVVVDRGIKVGGLKSEPDEVGCPCDFEIGGRGCAKKEIYKTVKEHVDEIAELLVAEMEAAR
ncbi:MAG: hypothetical protein SOR75_11420 [Synergistes jonesii]|uniref:hypothetical protein n=1 Tax=Synergistes jonesii TaxID=2754 RepID=UPI002A7502AA|nr:hypothetical protein [Synergistes jonesii]MDY2985919.1 hypothetical protein [Synergistes jonesii]